jgi:uncharacterized membrane protein
MTSSAVERAVARVLLWGGLVSVSLMLIGLCAYAAQDEPHAWERGRIVQKRQADGTAHVFTSLADVSRGLSQRPPDGLAIATLGLLCLLATPIAGVAVASVYFWLERDLPYALIGAVLLAMLLVSLVFVGGA